MGVDISAYSRLHLVPAHVDFGSADAYCEDEDHVEAYTQACFARSADGLADADVVVKTANGEWVATRCYERTSETRRESVLSMAYSGYNRWRAALCEAVNGLTYEAFWEQPSRGEAPFRDVIEFSDCEGSIGPVAAARLAADFGNAEYRGRFEAHVRRHVEMVRVDFWLKAWDGYLAGSRLASDGGLIRYR